MSAKPQPRSVAEDLTEERLQGVLASQDMMDQQGVVDQQAVADQQTMALQQGVALQPAVVAQPVTPVLSTLPIEIIQRIASHLPLSSAAVLALCSKHMLSTLGTVHFEQLRVHVSCQMWTFLSLLEKDLPPEYIFCYYCAQLHFPNPIRDSKYPLIPRKIYRACDDEDKDWGFVSLHSGLRIENFERILKWKNRQLDFKQLSLFSTTLRNADENVKRVLRPIGYNDHGFTFEVDFFFTSEIEKIKWNQHIDESFTQVKQFPRSPCDVCIPLGKQGKQIFTASCTSWWGPDRFVYFYRKKLKNQPKRGTLFFALCTKSFCRGNIKLSFGRDPKRKAVIDRNDWIMNAEVNQTIARLESVEEESGDEFEFEDGDGNEGTDEQIAANNPSSSPGASASEDEIPANDPDLSSGDSAADHQIPANNLDSNVKDSFVSGKVETSDNKPDSSFEHSTTKHKTPARTPHPSLKNSTTKTKTTPRLSSNLPPLPLGLPPNFSDLLQGLEEQGPAARTFTNGVYFPEDLAKAIRDSLSARR